MKHHTELFVSVRSAQGAPAMPSPRILANSDVCFTRRKLTAAEEERCFKANGWHPRERHVASAAVLVWVHPNNPVRSLTLPQLADIFSGQMTNWHEVGGENTQITAYGRQPYSGSYEFFKQRILPQQSFGPRVQEQPTSTRLLEAVSQDPSAIGYTFFITNAAVKAITLGSSNAPVAVAPTADAISTQAYPLATPLCAYVNPATDQGSIADFLDWICSEEGQKRVLDVGFIPLPKSTHRK